MAVRKGCVTWSLLLASVSLVILLGSLMMPWFGVKDVVITKNSDDSTEREESGTAISPYKEGFVSAYPLSSEYLSGLFKVIVLLTFVAVISLSVFILAAFLFLSGTVRGIRLQIMALSIAMLLCIVMPLTFMLTFPTLYVWSEEKSAERDGEDYTRTTGPYPTNEFFGKNVTEESHWYGKRTVTSTWGPDLGWFLPFVSAMLLGVSLFLVILGRRREDPSGTERPDKDDMDEEKTLAHTYGPDTSTKPDYESEEKPVYHPPQDEEEEKELYERLKKKYEKPEKNNEKPNKSKKKSKKGIEWEEEDTPSKEPKADEKDEWDALDEDEWETIEEEEPPAPKKNAKRHRVTDDP